MSQDANNKDHVKLTFIGTGAVYATPVFGCYCPACQLALDDPSYERLPASVLIQTSSDTLLIDAGHPRLDNVVRQYNIQTILLTHYHPDHVQGLFGLRWGMPNHSIDIIAPDDPVGCADLYKNSGILCFDRTTQPFQPLNLGRLTVTPLPMQHSKLTHGYMIEHRDVTIAYLTDTYGLDEAVISYLNKQSLDCCVIDCTYAPTEPAHNHNNLSMVKDIQAQLRHIPMWLTHIGHGMDAWYLAHHDQCNERELYMARDGLQLDF